MPIYRTGKTKHSQGCLHLTSSSLELGGIAAHNKEKGGKEEGVV